MPYSTSPASLVDPRRGAGTGAAVIFRNDNRGILSYAQQALNQRAARAYHEQQQAQKNEAERFKQYQTALKINDDTAPLYQEDYNGAVAAAKGAILPLYNEKSPAYVGDPFVRQGQVSKLATTLSGARQLQKDDWEVGKATIATAKGNPELDAQAIEKAWHNAHYTDNDPVNGKLIPATELPTGYHEAVLNDPKHINTVVATDNFFKKIPGSQEYANMIKGRPGTYSETDDLMTRLAAIEPDGKGGHQVKLDKTGRPVLRDPLGMLAALPGTKLGVLVENDVKQQAALRESAVKKMASMEPLTPEERAAANGPQKSKLDFLTDRALGHVTIKSKESRSYIPVPQGRAAKKPDVATGSAVISVVDGEDTAHVHRPGMPMTLTARNIPVVGQSFAPTKAGGKYPSLEVATRRAFVVGEGGKPGKHENVAGSLRLDKVVGRGLTLYDRQGEPMPFDVATDADAPSKMIEHMRNHPNSGSIVPVLFGENTEKSKVAGDGPGARTITRFVDSFGDTVLGGDGKPVTDPQKAAQMGGKPEYNDQYAGRVRKVVVRTTQSADQQLRAQAPDFDINRPGPEWERVRKAAAQYGWSYDNPYKKSGSTPAAKRATGVPALTTHTPAGGKKTGVTW